MFSEEKEGDEVLLKEFAFEVQTDEEQTHGTQISAAFSHARYTGCE